MAKGKKMTREEKRILEELTDIANASLGILTLEIRNSDEHDFHDLSVWQIRKALQAAYDLGAASRKDR